MSTLPAVTMQDLELEHAELLPSRETLHCSGFNRASNHQSAFLSNINVLSGDNVSILSFGSSQSATAIAGQFAG